jgi:hypothetical protein
MWTPKWIPREIDLVIPEIKSYIEKYQIEHIDFFDLTAVVNRNWTIAFCKRMIEEDLGVTWALPSGTRSEALDFEVLSLLRQSGFTKSPMQLSVYAKAFKRSFAKRLYGTSNGSWLLEVCNTRKCGVSLPARVLSAASAFRSSSKRRNTR